jgi:hypothetical protein
MLQGACHLKAGRMAAGPARNDCSSTNVSGYLASSDYKRNWIAGIFIGAIGGNRRQCQSSIIFPLFTVQPR